MQILVIIFLMIGVQVCGEIPETLRQEYASKLYEAFRLQSEGSSTRAFYLFQEGFQKGQLSGESLAKLQIVADLFYWYRRYGNHLKLFFKNPLGNNIISDEYKGQKCIHHQSNQPRQFGIKERYSEWGKNPEQAKLIQNFIFGVGEMISGIFMVVVIPQSNLFLGGGLALVTHGFYTIKDSLWDMWTQHEMEFFEFKNLSERAEQVSK